MRSAGHVQLEPLRAPLLSLGDRLGTLAAGLCAALALSGAACTDCEELKEEAAALLAEAEACNAGDTCELVDLYELAGPNTCLAPLQCTAALGPGADREDFAARARELADEFGSCGECAMAGCADPSTLVARCNEETGRCEAVTPR